MIDFHSHILPGIDDGSQSVEQSIAMLQEEAKQGVTLVVATPHFYPEDESVDAFLTRRDQAEALLRREMEKHENLPQLVVGTEVYYFTGISDSDILQKLTIGNSRYVLIEPPLAPWPDRIYRELEGILLQQGLMPVVAHIDRYIRPFHSRKILQQLARLPIMVQASGEFFLNKKTRNMALRMVKAFRIQILGSDAHNMAERAPNLGPAISLIKEKLGEEALEYIRECETLCRQEMKRER